MIRLSRTQISEIETLAEAAFPTESCGLLGGFSKDGEIFITHIRPSVNLAPGQENDRFEVDPKVRFDLMRELETTDEAMVGHFHSHPGGAAKPSEHDLDMAFEAELVWLITAVDQNGKAADTRAFRLDRESRSVEAVDIVIKEATAP